MTHRRIPITDKITSEIDIDGIKSIACCMQGWRKNMEDNYFMVQLPSGILMYGVLDGHGGGEVANFAAKYLPIIFKDLKSGFTNNEIENGFLELDKQLTQKGNEIINFSNNKKKSKNSIHKCRMLELKRDNPDMTIEEINSKLICDHVGSTVTIVFLDNQRIVTATAGDCQSLLYSNEVNIDLQKRIHQLCEQNEKERVEKSGLSVSGDPPRIEGQLAVSRGFGDMVYKSQGIPLLPPGEQPVNVLPEITIHERNINDQFILIGCDGLFEVFTSDIISKKIQESLKLGIDPQSSLETLLDDCMCPIGENETIGKDNMTCILIILNK